MASLFGEEVRVDAFELVGRRHRAPQVVLDHQVGQPRAVTEQRFFHGLTFKKSKGAHGRPLILQQGWPYIAGCGLRSRMCSSRSCFSSTGDGAWVSRVQPGALAFPRKEFSPREALAVCTPPAPKPSARDRKSTRLNSSHHSISYAVFCLK